MTTPAAQKAGTPAPAPLSLFRMGLAVLVLLTGVWRWWTISHWSWFADDWIYLYQTREQGFFAYVFQGYNSHLMPGQFLFTWVMTEWKPLDFGLAATVLTFFAVASLLAWAAAFREIFGEQVQLLLPLLLIALSPLLLMPTVWWASGIQVLPLQLFMGLSVLFLARYVLRDQRRRDMGWLLVSFAMGLFFWEKSLLIMIPLVFVGYVLLPEAPVARLRRLARMLVLPVALAACYSVLYLSTRRSGAIEIAPTQFAPRSFGEWWEFMYDSLRTIGIPTFAGGPFERMQDPWDNYSPATSFTATAIAVSVVALIIVALLARRGSIVAIGLTATYLVVSWGLVLTSDRYVDTLLVAAGTGRYAADAIPVVALSLGLLTTRSRAKSPGTAMRRALPSRVTWWGRLSLQALGCGVAVAIIAGNVAGWWSAKDNSPRPWVDAIVTDSKRVGEATLVNSVPPPNVIHPILFLEHAQISRMLAPLELPLQFDQPSGRLLIAGSDGHLMEADVTDEAAASRASPNPSCGYLVKPGKSTKIPMTIDLYTFGWGVRLDYFAELPTQIVVSTNSKKIPLNLSQGLKRVQFKVVDGIDSLRVSTPAGSPPTCVTQVFIGGFGPSDRSPWE